ncbi:MAG: hypothetical protein OEZ37_11235, partial [Gemmatimonadota bacterium]|nr:hypothetical protein [Gemmatimonadota bacterium]
MGSEPVVQHWLVVVAREAGLHGSRELDIPSDVDMPAAWKAVCDAAGISGDELATLVAGHYGMKAVALGPDDDNLAPR